MFYHKTLAHGQPSVLFGQVAQEAAPKRKKSREKRGLLSCMCVCVDYRLVDMYVLTATLLIRGSISLGGKRIRLSSFFSYWCMHV